MLAKTSEYNPPAINFFATHNNKKVLYYFFDSAGEAFFNSDNLVHHKFYNYFDGLILIIDPFSIKSIYQKFENEIKQSQTINPSVYPLEDIYQNFLLNLQKNYDIKVNEKIKKPLLILLSKTDFSSLSDFFFQEYNSSNEDSTLINSLDKKTRDFLMDNELEWFLRKIDWQFTNTKYLPITSKGSNSKGIDLAAKWFFPNIT